MMTVHEVSRLTGVSIRALHHYDRIGLLRPAEVTEAGYRLYDDAALERLQCILLFRELEFPLREIRDIVGSPAFDRQKALDQQVRLLRLKKEHLEDLIRLAEDIRKNGVRTLDFTAFDSSKMEEYAREAKDAWGQTEAWKEFEQMDAGRTPADRKQLWAGLMDILSEFGRMKQLSPADARPQAQVRKLQGYISEHFYTCTDRILAGLGQMYAAGGSMTENIDRAGGEGTAAFAASAIEAYCEK